MKQYTPEQCDKREEAVLNNLVTFCVSPEADPYEIFDLAVEKKFIKWDKRFHEFVIAEAGSINLFYGFLQDCALRSTIVTRRLSFGYKKDITTSKCGEFELRKLFRKATEQRAAYDKSLFEDFTYPFIAYNVKPEREYTIDSQVDCPILVIHLLSRTEGSKRIIETYRIPILSAEASSASDAAKIIADAASQNRFSFDEFNGTYEFPSNIFKLKASSLYGTVMSTESSSSALDPSFVL